ncbi:hypothetical protein LTR53_004455, partial [Teratosphaeriaceae sp. CCFEE 6253]
MADLKKLAVKLGTDGPHKVLPARRMIKILYNGSYIVQTTDASYVWEHPYYPQFYVPYAAIATSDITDGDTIATDDGKPIGKQLTLTVGDKSTSNLVAFDDTLAGPGQALAGLVKIDYDSMDAWFEEDTPVYVHPKDPFKRIDILASARHVRVFVDGVQVARTSMSSHLYEGALPCRYYMPFTAVDA